MAFKLDKNEYIVLIARRHWFKPVLETLMLVFSFLIPLFFTSIAYSIPDLVNTDINLGILSLIILISWFFIVWNISFVIWTNHFLDVLIITNFHIFDIDQIGLWHREISTIQINKIQDISSKTDGIIPSILGYGDLEIQSAGSLNNFIVRKIQKPDLIRQKINEQILIKN